MAIVTIFARAPVEGQVKTRLAQGVGETAALAFYRACVEGLAARLAGAGDWRLQIAVTPDAAATDPFFLAQPAAIVGQGAGDLGRRMARVLGRATQDAPAVIVGSDVPEIEARHVAAAVAALATHDLAIGPSPDGGYWLIGSARPPPPGLFDGVRWSSEHARADTLANAAGRSVAMLDWLEDVDDVASLARWRARAGR